MKKLENEYHRIKSSVFLAASECMAIDQIDIEPEDLTKVIDYILNPYLIVDEEGRVEPITEQEADNKISKIGERK